MQKTTRISLACRIISMLMISLCTMAFANPDGNKPEEGHQLRISPTHPLYAQIVRALKKKELKPGTRISIEIAPAAEQPQANDATDKLPNPTFLNNLLSVRNKGNKGRPDTIVTTATRSGNQPSLKLVALSPSQDAATIRSQPRLWWHQSRSTQGAELEFVLTEMAGNNTKEVFRRPIPAMSPGYHVIDLSHPSINPAGIALNPNKVYQWTINLRSGTTSSPVFCRIKYTPQPKLEQSVMANPTHPDTLKALGKAGNWYELYDAIASLTVRYPKEKSFESARETLLKQSGLAQMISQQ